MVAGTNRPGRAHGADKIYRVCKAPERGPWRRRQPWQGTRVCHRHVCQRGRGQTMTILPEHLSAHADGHHPGQGPRVRLATCPGVPSQVVRGHLGHDGSSGSVAKQGHHPQRALLLMRWYYSELGLTSSSLGNAWGGNQRIVKRVGLGVDGSCIGLGVGWHASRYFVPLSLSLTQ